MPTGDTIIEADDEVFFIAASNHIRQIMGELQKLESPYKKIMIAGGGNIGLGLAKALQDKYYVKLLEMDAKRAMSISDDLEDAIVLHADASNKKLLLDENIDQMDVFIAVTNKDEANIMSAMLAKKLGARKTIVLINRAAYTDIIQGSEIDISVSPQHNTASSLLRHIRKGDVANVYTLRKGAAEAIEAVAHGTEDTSKVVGKAIGDIELPRGTTIGAIVRGEKVIIAHHNIVIQSDDHVILFMVDKKYVAEVERLFQVDLTFF